MSRNYLNKLGAGGGKALRHGEKVLTPRGFVNIEDIQAGDLVVTPHNTIEVVQNVWPQGLVDIYRVTFQDGRTIDCCGEHLWQYHEAGKGSVRSKVVSTLELLRIVRKENAKEKGVRKRLPITPVVKPLEFGSKEQLPVNPYVLGAILGDGHININGMCYLTSMDSEIFESVEAAGYSLGKPQVKDNGNNKAKTCSILGLSPIIKSLGLGGTLSQSKFIPEAYKQASIEDRFSLVQGLMDTDGYVDSGGSVYFDTTSKVLAEGLTYILHSLGYTVTCTTKIGSYKKDGERILCSTVYKLYIRGANSTNLFRLSRKVSRCKSKPIGNRIVDIQCVGKDFATCISVSGKEKLFVTTNFIVTHNSFTCLTKNLDGIDDPGFRCAILRRYEPELKKPGGLIDTSKQVYPDFTPMRYKTQAKQWQFPSGATISFSAISCDDDLGSWQGSQMTRILVDEAGDKWTEKQILFLASRLRSEAKMHHQLILTANPDINSFLKNWVNFCLDPDTGVPVPGTEHRIRWMITLDSKVLWADTPEESFELHGKHRGMVYARGMSAEELKKHHPSKLFMPKSFRFIPTGVFDNPYLLPPRNSTYLADLLSQPYVNQLKFLHGSWTAKEEGGSYFKREWVEVVDYPPVNPVARVRSWDFAASEPSAANNYNPDWTAGVKMSRDKYGIYYIEDVKRAQVRTDKVLKTVAEVAIADGLDECQVTIPKDPGAAGATANAFYIRTLAEQGVPARSCQISGHSGKTTRFKPFAALAESGSVKIVRGDWNEAYLSELENFDGSRGVKDDQVDATSDGFATLARQVQLPIFSVPVLEQPSVIPKI